MGPVPVGVAVALAGKLALDQLDPLERGVLGVDAGIEHRDRDPEARGASGLDSSLCCVLEGLFEGGTDN